MKLAETLRAKALSWRAIIDPSLPEVLCGDGTRISQIILNFASNAAKFTKSGTITVRATRMLQRGTSFVLRVDVEDTGVGITPEQQQRIFRAFEQADDSTTRRFGGTGLGLAISRRIAQLMNGEVGVSSTPGVGSTFWLNVPLEDGISQPLVTAPTDHEAALRSRQLIAAMHAGARVLVAEDNAVNQEVMRAFMAGTGLLLDVAANGQEAVEMAARHAYDLILMDMQMPVMDGLAATRAIRSSPGGLNVSIIALTANAFAEDGMRCIEACMNDHVGKPVDLSTLYTALLKWLPTNAAAPRQADVIDAK